MIQRIKEQIAALLGIDSDDIEDDANITEDLGVEPLDLVDIFMWIEEQFGVTVPDEDVPTIRTVRNMADYVERNL